MNKTAPAETILEDYHVSFIVHLTVNGALDVSHILSFRLTFECVLV